MDASSDGVQVVQNTCVIFKNLLSFSIADPHPDPTFHSDADPDPTFYFDADPDPASQNDANP